MDRLLSFIIFVSLLSYCDPWFFDGVADHGNVQRCPQSIPRDNFLYALNDTCIQLIREEHSWKDARRHCTQNHGDLVVIQDMAKQQVIMNALKTSGWVKNGIWIGGTDREKEGHWKWVNGQSMTWGNWERGQGPGNRGFLFSGGQFEDCAVIRKDDGYKWHDYACNLPQYHYGSICEYNFIPTTSRPTTQTLTTHAQTTQTSTTPELTTQTSTTPTPTTQTSTTPVPTTQTSTTPVPTTHTSITPEPTTQTSTTPAPTTQTSTTPVPTTQTSTTPVSTSQTSTTPTPTTHASTTPVPTTQTSTTPAPTTHASTTPVPTTKTLIPDAPTTHTSKTTTPTTQTSTTPVPTTRTSTTYVPTTQISITPAPTTQKLTTPVPTTQISTTPAQTTQTTTTPAQTTQTSITPAPTTQKLTTPVPTTQKSTTPAPTTKKSTTPASTSQTSRTRLTKAAPSTTHGMKETKTMPTVTLTTQQVNNQGGLLKRSENGQKPTHKSSTGYIIGGVCVAVVVAGIIVAVVVFRRRRISSTDAKRTVHGAENPMYSVMYDDTSVPPVGTDIQINDMYEPKVFYEWRINVLICYLNVN